MIPVSPAPQHTLEDKVLPKPVLTRGRAMAIRQIGMIGLVVANPEPARNVTGGTQPATEAIVRMRRGKRVRRREPPPNAAILAAAIMISVRAAATPAAVPLMTRAAAKAHIVPTNVTAITKVIAKYMVARGIR